LFPFFSGRDGDDDIYVMNADGSGPANLSNNPAGDYAPDWGTLPQPTEPQPPVGYTALVPVIMGK
jgi:hypothetical protein